MPHGGTRRVIARISGFTYFGFASDKKYKNISFARKYLKAVKRI
jgi:hypothetical protein